MALQLPDSWEAEPPTSGQDRFWELGDGVCGGSPLQILPSLGLIGTWPASPGLEGCREEVSSGRGTNEESQQRQPLGAAAGWEGFQGARREEGERRREEGGSRDPRRELASRSLPPHSSRNFFRSLGYRRIAISKFSKKSQKWRLFARSGANVR